MAVLKIFWNFHFHKVGFRATNNDSLTISGHVLHILKPLTLFTNQCNDFLFMIIRVQHSCAISHFLGYYNYGEVTHFSSNYLFAHNNNHHPKLNKTS